MKRARAFADFLSEPTKSEPASESPTTEESWGMPLEELLERSTTTNITESDDERELEYRVRHGDSELELYARGYIATDAALAIKLALSHDDE